MCKCTPGIRTPFCGKIGCEWKDFNPEKHGSAVDLSKVDLSKNESKTESAIIISGRKLQFFAKNDLQTNTDKLYIRGEFDAGKISDGYHTFDELYDHRITLYIALCKQFALWYEPNPRRVWRSARHSDGEICFGTGTQYVLGIGDENGKQITYHIPVERWAETDFAETLEKAPEFDGHTSADVLERLKQL